MQHQPELVDTDPLGPSYPQSAIQYLPYRVGIVLVAVGLIMIGKSSLPSDAVGCLQDVLIDGLQPVTNAYIKSPGLGLALMTMMQLFVDMLLISSLVYWFLKGTSFRFPILLALLGLMKIFLNLIFETAMIKDSFHQQLFPSLVFGENFRSTYFFSGVVAFLTLVLLEMIEISMKKVMIIIQFVAIVLVIFLLLSMRQNFFMDVVTAIVFSYLIFMAVSSRANRIDRVLLIGYDSLKKKIGSREETE